uniref:Uncharacterized protein n=1 Tax=Leersia perrieri TaxID=77586 RepID=A0A0D9VUV2_9ORYZ
MSFSKLSKMPLFLPLLIIAILSSEQLIVCSQGRPLMAMATQRRHLLSSSSPPHSDNEAAGGNGETTMTQGNIMPDGESGGGIVDDARPTAPGHSPGAGHAFTNKNGVGRKLLDVIN